MKVAYVAMRLENPTSGVYNKTLQQAAAAQQAGLDVDFYLLQTQHDSYQAGNLTCIKVELPQSRCLRLIETTLLPYRLLARQTALARYDRIILRHLAAGHFSYGAFFDLWPGRIISEHHTKELAEFRNEPKTFRNVSRMLGEALIAPAILRRCVGVIGVTDEIRDFQCARRRSLAPSATVSNGVDVDGVRFTRFQPFDGRRLALIFVAARFRPWHGLDRLLDGLDRYRGDVVIELRLVGSVHASDLQRIAEHTSPNVRIQLLGTLTGAELDAQFASANLAVSSLALDRNGLSEGCVLKTREYVARGIPFLYGYRDIDLDTDCEFALHLGEPGPPIDMAAIVEFAARVAKRRGIDETMRNYARARMDWRIKMSQMIEFVESTG